MAAEEGLPCGVVKGPERGVLKISPDRTRFQFESDTAMASPLDFNLDHLKKLVPNKVAEKAAIMLRIQLNDGSEAMVLKFATLELRQRAKDLLEQAKSALPRHREDNAGLVPDRSGTAESRSRANSPQPAESHTPIPSRASPIPVRGSIRLSGGPASFNIGQRLSVDDVRARAEVLRKNAQVKKLHEELVDGNLINEDDFWIGKEMLVEQEKLRHRQKQGLAPESLLDPSQDAGIRSGPTEEVELEMTKDMMERVFREHPEVRRKYDENVPHKMSENQFWTAYVHCKYVVGTRRSVERDRLKRTQVPTRRTVLDKKQREAAQIFGDVDDYRLERKFELESKYKERILGVDASIDLRLTLDDALGIPSIAGLARVGYGIAERTEADMLMSKDEKEIQRHLRARNVAIDKDVARKIHEAVQNDPVLTKINERAVLALSSLDSAEVIEGNALRRVRFSEERRNDLNLDYDLGHSPVPAVIPFKLAPAARSSERTSASEHSPAPKLRKFGEKIRMQPSQAWPNFTSDLVHLSADQDPETSLLRLDPHLGNLPDEIRDRLLVATTAVDEFCRHFWASSDASEASLKKRCSIVEKLSELRPQIDVELRSILRHEASDALPLLRLPLAQLAVCVEEHTKQCRLNHH